MSFNRYDNCYNKFLLSVVDSWPSDDKKAKKDLRRVFSGKCCIICESKLKMITFYMHRHEITHFTKSKIRPTDVLHYKINVCKKCFKSKDKQIIEAITKVFDDAKYIHGFISVASSINCKCILGYEVEFVNACLKSRETDRISKGIGNLCVCHVK